MGLRSRESRPQHFGEHDRVVVLAVVGGVDEGERARPRSAPELRELRPRVPKLADVAATELGETVRLVSEPFPELGARRQLLLPLVELRLLLRDAARPEPID